MPRFTAPSSPRPSKPLIAADEPAPFEVVGHAARFRALIVCDHASRLIPRALGELGLPPPALRRHIAWDIGAGELARSLAQRLELRAVLCTYSRLVIDCNRSLEDSTSITPESDGQGVPGNLALTREARLSRQREIFWPYHEAIESQLAHLVQGPHVPALIAVHSFTPSLGGQARPWHCGILWDRDGRLPLPLMERLRTESGLLVGDNVPYSGRDPEGLTVDLHAARRGWPHVCIEVRQDLLAREGGVAAWVERLGAALKPILAQPQLYQALEVAP